MVVVCLALVGIVLHALEQHGDDKAVRVDPVPSESDITSSGSGLPRSELLVGPDPGAAGWYGR